MSLIKMRDSLTGRVDLGEGWSALITNARARVEGLVNEFFKAKLMGITEVVEFLEAMEETKKPGF
ncbi:MAG: hypothetical protein B6I35_12085 [Anaerolineaceae bacterium 4572_32.2]|nr:MAG: hypothetical protein B6I35_12085 [Anaerolineaceae bacterium 4572_32.2]